MPEQNKLSTEANNTGCQDYELLAEYHSDIGQGRPRPTGTRGYKIVKRNGNRFYKIENRTPSFVFTHQEELKN